MFIASETKGADNWGLTDYFYRNSNYKVGWRLGSAAAGLAALVLGRAVCICIVRRLLAIVISAPACSMCRRDWRTQTRVKT